MISAQEKVSSSMSDTIATLHKKTTFQMMYPQVVIGLKSGGNLSKMQFVPSVRQEMSRGLTGGVFIRYYAEPHVGVQAEFNIAQGGWTERDSAFTYFRQLNYLTLPVLSFFTIGNGHFTGFLDIGPQISYLVSSTTGTTGRELVDSHSEQTLKIASRFDYSICVGGGVEVQTKYINYQLEGRYQYGLGDIFTNSLADDFQTSSNQIISITLGVSFNLKH